MNFYPNMNVYNFGMLDGMSYQQPYMVSFELIT